MRYPVTLYSDWYYWCTCEHPLYQIWSCDISMISTPLLGTMVNRPMSGNNLLRCQQDRLQTFTAECSQFLNQLQHETCFYRLFRAAYCLHKCHIVKHFPSQWESIFNNTVDLDAYWHCSHTIQCDTLYLVAVCVLNNEGSIGVNNT